MTKIEIGGRLIPMAFTLGAWADMEEEVCKFDELKTALSGKNRIRVIVKLIRITGNAALATLGLEPDLTDKWLEARMTPAGLNAYQVAVSEAIASGMKMETEEDKQKERDLVLEEIQKKSKPGV